jgi:hypothetical protein
MSEVQSAILKVFVDHAPDIGKWLSKRPMKKAADAAIDLSFWPDGMLDELTLLANGKATDASFKKLEKKLKSTAKDVADIVEGLKDSRSRIAKLNGGETVVAQINQIIFNEETGKLAIRRDIKILIDAYKRTKALDDYYVRNQALQICNAVDVFNAGLNRLKRLVRDL